MAASTGVADVGRVHLTLPIGVFQNLVLAMAIGAKRRLHNAAGKRLPMYAGSELIYDIAVAHRAGVGDRGAEGLRFRGKQFMRAAVAEGAIGGAFVAALAGLSMGAFGIIGGLRVVAGHAGRFCDVGRMGILIVRFVAGIAGKGGMRALGELCPLLVACGALRCCRVKMRSGGTRKKA